MPPSPPMPPLLGRLHEPPAHACDGLSKQILCNVRESIKIRNYRVYAEQTDTHFSPNTYVAPGQHGHDDAGSRPISVSGPSKRSESGLPSNCR